MESKVKFAGHPVHPMLIVFPLGLLATSVVFDLVAQATGTGFAFSVVTISVTVPAGTGGADATVMTGTGATGAGDGAWTMTFVRTTRLVFT